MLNSLKNLLNLHEGEERPEIVLTNVAKNLDFRGPNLWILACAIFIASIGLNVNSTAVIIGAMLISPLMGPIVGAGFALGIYDFQLLKKSIRNLVLATIVSLGVSALYFFISPFKDIQSELLARTAPNIYDVLIAFCGGLVGVIAITRVEKGNPIPGVAIATALMPPLCTAGYGIATGNLSYFFGAFYLYAINCTFIAISTFIIIKYLKYPAKKQVNEKQQRLVRNSITLLIAVMLIPSSLLAYNLYNEQGFKKTIDAFLEKEFLAKGYTVVYKKSNYNASPRTLELAFLSHRFSDTELDTLDRRLDKALKQKTQLIIRQDSTDRLAVLKGDILNELNFRQQDIAKQQLEKQAIEKAGPRSDVILKEAKILFPDLQSISITQADFAFTNDSMAKKSIAIIETKKNISDDEKTKLTAWLKQRLNNKTIELYKKDLK